MGSLRAAPASFALRGMWILRRLSALLVAALMLIALPVGVAARVLIVTKRHVGYLHYGSIQRAVNAARPGDWILIDRGVYDGNVLIRTSRLHLRGLNRNGVILDGRHRAGNGIEILANGVWVENLTVRDFDRRALNDDANGNEIWWNGATHRGRIGINGWWGQYLTAYDTGLLGGYGEYAQGSVDGGFKHIYASGFDDSGLYIGGCRNCHALVQDALMERNGFGYSGSNAGGDLVIEDSVFRDNSVGVVPNSYALGDPPPPQDGACNSGSNRSKTPSFNSTKIARCTMFRHNLIADNGNIHSPAEADVLQAPWGVGIEMPGTYADLVEDNRITGNPNFGLLAFEFPDPFGERDAVRGRRHRTGRRRLRRKAVSQQLSVRKLVYSLDPRPDPSYVGLPACHDAQPGHGARIRDPQAPVRVKRPPVAASAGIATAAGDAAPLPWSPAERALPLDE
jgi:hypothetical protein